MLSTGVRLFIPAIVFQITGLLVEYSVLDPEVFFYGSRSGFFKSYRSVSVAGFGSFCLNMLLVSWASNFENVTSIN
jgi:hypothetical protein